MIACRTESARHETRGHPKGRPVPRAAAFRWFGFIPSIAFAVLLAMPGRIPPAVAGSDLTLRTNPPSIDANGDGVEDVLTRWRAGDLDWSALRDVAVAATVRPGIAKNRDATAVWSGPAAAPTGGVWEQGRVRILQLGGGRAARDRARAAGYLQVVHDLSRLDASVLALDEAGLRAYLDAAPGGRILLDRDGLPALDHTRSLVGAPGLTGDPWRLGDDWSATVAILDSGCDTAHGDLGDSSDDDRDGPAPAVGDATDWYPAASGWPIFAGYKVVGWHDVTDDFPEAQGPWDYHYHGTALASAVAGAGVVDAAGAGMVPGGRLTVVKFYDFDVTWHAWAGDFLAACEWVLANHETQRVRTVLSAVNWDIDSGISDAVDALLDAGILPVVAVGNHGEDPAGPGYPARLPGVLTCGGVNDDGAVAAFSGRGLPGQAKPDLMAPSGGLLEVRGRVTVADNEPDDSYSGRSGTSLAAAHAAGAVYLMDEALRDRGVVFPPGREGALLRGMILRSTAVPVDWAETADGTGQVALSAPLPGDPVQGAGLLRVDAAVAMVCQPLESGSDQDDIITLDWERPVLARRLVTTPGVRYLVEARPQPGLDIELSVVDPRGLVSGLDDVSVTRDVSGAGVSEFTYVRPVAGHWLGLVVKRIAGQGTVTLRMLEADTFPTQGHRMTLPGTLTGNLNVGTLGGSAAPTMVVPSRVRVDDAARALTLVGTDGAVPAGWPTFFFPHVSAQGGLNLPLVWDLDGQAGDEIVATTEYGSVYFVAADGNYTEIGLGLNVRLTPAVGLETGGTRRVACVDGGGSVRAWTAGGVEVAQTDLTHANPLAPAVGILTPGADEALVVAFADGHVVVLDTDLQVLPGWPRDLGVVLTMAPVLLDLDSDGDHEIAIPVWNPDAGSLHVRVLEGDGSPHATDGTVLPAPTGGVWWSTTPAVVSGRSVGGELGLSVLGLVEVPLGIDRSRWLLAAATLRLAGVQVETHPVLDVTATTSQGQLLAQQVLLAPPLAWDQTGDARAEPGLLMSLEWQELLYGVTTIPGASTGWYLAGPTAQPQAAWQPLDIGGPAQVRRGRAGAALCQPEDGSLIRVHVFDSELVIHPVPEGGAGAAVWPVARFDGRNTGAMDLKTGVSAAAPVIAAGSRLRVFPNPGSGRIYFQLDADHVAGRTTVEIFDLRGRRLRRLTGDVTPLVWDGRGRDGRRLAAGTYLAVARRGTIRHVQRVVLTH